jgi:hypothetical protein
MQNWYFGSLLYSSIGGVIGLAMLNSAKKNSSTYQQRSYVRHVGFWGFQNHPEVTHCCCQPTWLEVKLGVDPQSGLSFLFEKKILCSGCLEL